MHHKLKGGGKRNWHLEKNKIQYINAAKVPRITKKNGKNIHHHICLELSKTKTPSVMEVFLQF